ncbi:MAG TPA: VTT domain-containing protein [Gemmatimonadaceae bacterium]|nr:VTT domain-containing protein [Gemmatimonadaceae bacterium]
MLSRLIAALHRWAESGWSGTATAVWELLQGSFMPGPSGIVFAPLAVADPPRAPRLAVWALAGAVAGGCIAYLIGARAFDEIGRPVLSMLGVSPARLASSERMFDRHGWLIVFVSTISPLSTKLTCIAAGAFGLTFPVFLPALAVGRAIRFAVLTILLRLTGERLLPRLLKRHAAKGDGGTSHA